MKVLWITNILFPDICKELGISAPVTGGWMHSSVMALQKCGRDIDLAVASLYSGRELKRSKINGITYYCLPSSFQSSFIKKNFCRLFGRQNTYDENLETYWRQVKEEFQPDVVHIHGTEFTHGLAYLRSCGSENVVASIQGLVSVYARYADGLISKELRKNRTLIDYIRPSLEEQFRRRGIFEQEYLRRLKYIIGRTDWDRVHALAVNPDLKYFFHNETLRGEFYNHSWDIHQCEKHSIFLSQAASPIKGIHFAIKALPYIIRKYPDVKVYVGGYDLTSKDGLEQRLKFTAYPKYVCALIKQLDLEKHLIFLGSLDEKQMVQRYLKSHVFVCPSTIENSPNSLGEAQLLGVPIIASYVGGIPNMVTDGKSGLLYRCEEYEMLADCVCRIFEDENFANGLSMGEKKVASKRHDRENNALMLCEIYREIIDSY